MAIMRMSYHFLLVIFSLIYYLCPSRSNLL
jgi:hypothetical protein